MSQIIVNNQQVQLDVVSNPATEEDVAAAQAANALITLRELASDVNNANTGIKSYASVVAGDASKSQIEPPCSNTDKIMDNLDLINAECKIIYDNTTATAANNTNNTAATDELMEIPTSVHNVLPEVMPPTPSTSPISSKGSLRSYGSDDGLDKPNPVQLRKAKSTYPPDTARPPPGYFAPGLNCSDGITHQIEPEVQIQQELINVESDIDIEEETRFMKGKRRQRRRRFLKRRNKFLEFKKSLEMKHKRTRVPFVSLWDVVGTQENRRVKCYYCKELLVDIDYAHLAHHHAICRQKSLPIMRNKYRLCEYDSNHHIPEDRLVFHLLQCPSAPAEFENIEISTSKSLEEDILKRIEMTCKLWHIAPSTGKTDFNFIRSIIQSFSSNQNISPDVDYEITTKRQYFQTKYPNISINDLDLLYKDDDEHWWDTELSK